MEEQNIINSGDKPTLLNLNNVARSNRFYRKEIWTGEYLQLTVMSIPVGGEVGLELHNENKQGVKFMGNVNSDYAIFIPAGTWHNIINDGNVPLKLYSVYAPPHHPKGTVHKTKFDSDLADY